MIRRLLPRLLIVLLLVIPFVPLSPKKTTSPAVKSAVTHTVVSPVSADIPLASLSAASIYVVDLQTDSVLYQKNPDQILNPASLTKIMTGLIALEHYPEDEILTAYSVADTLGNTMKLVAGDQLTSSDLLSGLLIASANDAALTFAENFPGGYTQFVKTMNQKAKELGMEHTHFTNVSGVEDPQHYTTATDLFRLTQYALQQPTIARIVATKNLNLTSLKGNKYSLTSTNELLGLPGVIGVKTGWTPEAGECLITLINRNGHPVLTILLKSDDRFGETKTVIDWIYKNFTWQSN